MDSNSNYSQFIEHSFRRLTLLIHQQDVLDTTTNKTTEQSSSTNNPNDNGMVLFPSKVQSHQRSIDNKSADLIETKVNVKPISRTYRTYMRPPKNRATVPHRCSSSQCSDRSESSFNHLINTPCSPSVTQQESSELPLHMPYERTLYDIQFERDHKNDIRQKYNIPSPFERKWLRQPRYIPQERPNIGQIHQSRNH